MPGRFRQGGLLFPPLVVVFTLALWSCGGEPPDKEFRYPADAKTPYENPFEPELMRMVAQAAASPEVDLVFLGDSITAGWRRRGKPVWGEFYSSRRAANFGVGMAQTGSVLWRIDAGHFDVIRPRLIVMMIGTNNTHYGRHSPEQIADGVTAIVARLRTKLPETKILVLAIFPRGRSLTDPYRVNNENANRLLAHIADEEWVYFRDIGATFLRPDGSIKPEAMVDPVHLSEVGYRLWAEAIEDDVIRLLQEQ